MYGKEFLKTSFANNPLNISKTKLGHVTPIVIVVLTERDFVPYMEAERRYQEKLREVIEERDILV